MATECSEQKYIYASFSKKACGSRGSLDVYVSYPKSTNEDINQIYIDAIGEMASFLGGYQEDSSTDLSSYIAPMPEEDRIIENGDDEFRIAKTVNGYKIYFNEEEVGNLENPNDVFSYENYDFKLEDSLLIITDPSGMPI